MKIQASIISLIGFLVLILSFGAFVWAPQGFISLEYALEPSSELYIQGSSNVNNFTCYCNQEFEKQSLKAEVFGTGQELRFQKTRLTLPVFSLDCGKKRMNKDMYETLKAESYPNIFIELKRAYRKGSRITEFSEEWTNLNAEAVITIAGVEQNFELLVSVKKTSDGKVKLMSNKDLRLTQFGLEPPTALLGIIKVHDCININLDLTVSVVDPS